MTRPISSPRSPASSSLPLIALILLALASCRSGGDADPVPADGSLPTPTLAVSGDASGNPVGDASGDPNASANSATLAPNPALDAFAEQVAQALEAGDAATLTPVLSDPFALGYNGSEWQVLDRAAAAQQLTTSHMPPGSALEVTNSNQAVREALAGRVDIDGLFGPQAGQARMLLVTGWDGEPDRQGVVFLTPGQGQDAGNVWTALLIVR